MFRRQYPRMHERRGMGAWGVRGHIRHSRLTPWLATLAESRKPFLNVVPTRHRTAHHESRGLKMKRWSMASTLCVTIATAPGAHAQREFPGPGYNYLPAIPSADQCAQLKSFRTLSNGRHVPWNRCAELDSSYASKYPPKLPGGDKAESHPHEGAVILVVAVEANGSLSDIRVERSSGYLDLDVAAHKAVERWRFLPAYQAGVPERSYVRVPVTFEIAD